MRAVCEHSARVTVYGISAVSLTDPVPIPNGSVRNGQRCSRIHTFLNDQDHSPISNFLFPRYLFRAARNAGKLTRTSPPWEIALPDGDADGPLDTEQECQISLVEVS